MPGPVSRTSTTCPPSRRGAQGDRAAPPASRRGRCATGCRGPAAAGRGRRRPCRAASHAASVTPRASAEGRAGRRRRRRARRRGRRAGREPRAAARTPGTAARSRRCAVSRTSMPCEQLQSSSRSGSAPASSARNSRRRRWARHGDGVERVADLVRHGRSELAHGGEAIAPAEGRLRAGVFRAQDAELRRSQRGRRRARTGRPRRPPSSRGGEHVPLDRRTSSRRRPRRSRAGAAERGDVAEELEHGRPFQLKGAQRGCPRRSAAPKARRAPRPGRPCRPARAAGWRISSSRDSSPTASRWLHISRASMVTMMARPGASPSARPRREPPRATRRACHQPPSRPASKEPRTTVPAAAWACDC